MTPAVGLKSGQKVLVQASGFSPAESLVVTECAAKGTATGPGDCDLNGMQSTTSDASGRVKVDLTVTKGPFGANNIVCGPAQACLISVTQATPSPTQEADTSIAFGLSGHAHRCRAAEGAGMGAGDRHDRRVPASWTVPDGTRHVGTVPAPRVHRLEGQMAALTEVLVVLTRGLESSPLAEPLNRHIEQAARRAYELLLLAKSAAPGAGPAEDGAST